MRPTGTDFNFSGFEGYETIWAKLHRKRNVSRLDTQRVVGKDFLVYLKVRKIMIGFHSIIIHGYY